MSAFDESLLSGENSQAFEPEDQASFSQQVDADVGEEEEQGDVSLEEEDDEEEQVEVQTTSKTKAKLPVKSKTKITTAKAAAVTSTKTIKKKSFKQELNIERNVRNLIKKRVQNFKTKHKTLASKVPTSLNRSSMDCIKDGIMLFLEQIERTSCDITRQSGKKNVPASAVDAAIRLACGTDSKLGEKLINAGNLAAEKMSVIIEQKRKNAKEKKSTGLKTSSPRKH